MESLKNMYTQTFEMDSGRVGRAGFWLAMLQLVLALVVAVIGYATAISVLTNSGIDLTFGGMVYSPRDIVNTIVVVPAVIMGLWTWMAVVSIQVRRVRDLGISGWWFAVLLILGLVPFLGLLTIIVMIFKTDSLKDTRISKLA